jgi:hypothetical protein
MKVYVVKQRIKGEDFLHDICLTRKIARVNLKRRKVTSIFVKPVFFIEDWEVKTK